MLYIFFKKNKAGSAVSKYAHVNKHHSHGVFQHTASKAHNNDNGSYGPSQSHCANVQPHPHTACVWADSPTLDGPPQMANNFTLPSVDHTPLAVVCTALVEGPQHPGPGPGHTTAGQWPLWGRMEPEREPLGPFGQCAQKAQSGHWHNATRNLTPPQFMFHTGHKVNGKQ